jgi:HSP20 family protein
MTRRFDSTFSNPFDRLVALQREIERAFEKPRGFDLGVTGRGVFPPVNVFQGQEGYLARVEVPGVAPEKIDIRTEGQTLTISGEREDNPVEGASYHRRERESGKFSRSLALPPNLDLSAAQASYKHGVLTIRVPLKASAKPRQIEVQAA